MESIQKKALLINVLAASIFGAWCIADAVLSANERQRVREMHDDRMEVLERQADAMERQANALEMRALINCAYDFGDARFCGKVLKDPAGNIERLCSGARGGC